jgi:hypothetical protein
MLFVQPYCWWSRLLDPFGLAALAILTKYWTAVERNTLMPALSGCAALQPAHLDRRHGGRPRHRHAVSIVSRFAAGSAGQRLSLRKTMRTSKAGPADATAGVRGEQPPRQCRLQPLPRRAWASRRGGAASAALLALVRHDMLATFRHPGYLVLVFIGCVNAGGALWFADEGYGTATLPVTRVMIETLRGAFTIIPLLIAIDYAGELVWSQPRPAHARDHRCHASARTGRSRCRRCWRFRWCCCPRCSVAAPSWQWAIQAAQGLHRPRRSRHYTRLVRAAWRRRRHPVRDPRSVRADRSCPPRRWAGW